MLGSPSALALLPPWQSWPQLQLRGSAAQRSSRVVPVALQQRLSGAYGALAYGFRTALDAADADTEFDAGSCS